MARVVEHHFKEKRQAIQKIIKVGRSLSSSDKEFIVQLGEANVELVQAALKQAEDCVQHWERELQNVNANNAQMLVLQLAEDLGKVRLTRSETMASLRENMESMKVISNDLKEIVSEKNQLDENPSLQSTLAVERQETENVAANRQEAENRETEAPEAEGPLVQTQLEQLINNLPLAETPEAVAVSNVLQDKDEERLEERLNQLMDDVRQEADMMRQLHDKVKDRLEYCEKISVLLSSLHAPFRN